MEAVGGNLQARRKVHCIYLIGHDAADGSLFVITTLAFK